MLVPLAVLGSLAVLFVGGEVVEQYLFPSISVGMKHALLTARAAMATLLGCGVVYWVMRKQQSRLAATAEHISRLLESYGAKPAQPQMFDNPHLAHCRDVLVCKEISCPADSSPRERCWQQMALASAATDGADPPVSIRQCHSCPVYRACCPDELTALGESFNNLLFLLDVESSRVERMRAQMEERQRLAAVGQIAAGFAHEIRNPLSSISSVIQMIKRRHDDPAYAVEQVDVIAKHAGRISDTVTQMIDMTRPAHDQWERIDLRELISEAVSLISHDCRRGNVRIELDCPSRLPSTYVLRGRLRQVFIDLIQNARDAMPDGGDLTIRARQRDHKIILRFADTGQGIASEIGRRVFEPFFTTKDPGKGIGLGLSVSYNIVARHRGRIDFESTVGKGTVFTVELPIIPSPPRAVRDQVSTGSQTVAAE
ncbi:MAG: hypothetical protein JSU63_02330 [Phycisphaerales bacterium]|nr:MAG: hypothetical protein JSU63_02330 [Phycisphaerales bacterium]